MKTTNSNSSQTPDPEGCSLVHARLTDSAAKFGDFHTVQVHEWLIRRPSKHTKTERAFWPIAEPKCSLNEADVIHLKTMIQDYPGLAKMMAKLGLRVVEIK